MKNTIIPSIIVKSQKELDKRIKKVKKYSSWVQLDVMDGKFVKNKSFSFDFSLNKWKGLKYEAHLMVKNPREWIEENSKKVDLIIFHIESCKNSKEVKDIIKLIRKKKRKVGLALNPKTSIGKIKQFLKLVNMVLVMTVIPGKYGSKFLPSTLKKVKQLKKLKPKMNIEVDGGISDKTISFAFEAEANMFVSGSYIQKARDVGKAVKKLNCLVE